MQGYSCSGSNGFAAALAWTVAGWCYLRSARFASISVLTLLVAACGGGGDGGSGGTSPPGPPPPPPPPPIIESTDDVFVGLLSGMPNRLDVLNNDPAGETIVFVSRGNVGNDIEIDDENALIYTPGGNFVGEDHFHYITENASGTQTRSEVALRVDQVSNHGNAIDVASSFYQDNKTVSAAQAKRRDGAYKVPYELYGGIEVITQTTNISETDFGQLTRVHSIPSSAEDNNGRKQGHKITARLRKNVRYLIAVEYSMDRENDITPPLIWSEYPQTVITDSYSVPLYDDLCVFYEDWINGDFWACHTNQTGSRRVVGQTFTPRVTDEYNIYVWSQVYVFDEKLVILCEELPSFGCGYDVHIEEIDDNTSTLFSASIAIGGSPVHGRIETSDDTDWFTTSTYATETTIIKVYPEDDAEGETLDSFGVELFTADGRLLATGVQSGGVSTLQYNASDDASLRVRIVPASGDTGGYRIESVGGDVPNNPDTYAGARVGDTVDGRINNGRDIADWYKIYLEAGIQYRASITTQAAEIPNPRLSIIDIRGETVLQTQQQRDAGCGQDCEIEHSMAFSLVRSGYYFMSASAPEPGQSGEFAIRVEETDTAPADDYSDDTFTVGRAGSFVASQGVLETANDVDWFRVFSRNGGETRAIHVDGAYVSNGQFEYPEVSVVTDDGSVLATAEVWTEGTQRVEFVTAADNYYYLVVRNTGARTVPYTVHSNVSDPSGDRNTWAFIGPCGEVADSVSTRMDSDWYNIRLFADHTYRFTLTPDDRGFGMIDQPILTLYDKQGGDMETVRTVGEPAIIEFRIGETGDYFLGVNNAGLRHGGFRLGVTDLDAACAM